MDKNNLLMFHRLSMDLFCVLDIEGNVVDINDSFLKQLNWHSSEVLGKNIFRFVSRKDHADLRLLYEKLTHSTDVEEFDCYLRKSSGEEQLYRSNCYYDEETKRFFIVSILSEMQPIVNRTHQTNTNIEETNDVFQEIQAIAKIGSWSYDVELDEVHWSRQMYKLVGRDPKKGIPTIDDYRELILKEDFELWQKTLEKCLRDGEPYVFTYRIVNPFQGIIWVESRGKGFYDESGSKVIKMQGVSQDITYLKLKEARLQVAMKEAQKLARSKDQFLANMSHEIRTPLNGILGMTEILLTSNLTLEQKDYLNIMKSSGQSLLEIINDILDLSKVESGLLKINKKEFKLEEMMNNLYYLFLNLANSKNINLSIDIDKSLRGNLVGDEMKLRQILTNLMGNALKFTKEGAVSVKANIVDIHEKHLFIRFSVKDSGFGINQKMVGDSIFKPFVQETKNIIEEFGGTGLGLSISSQLVELMGGSLDYKSEVAVGSEFWFTLGFDVVKRKEEKKPKNNDKKKTSNDKRKLKILVVEDNQVNRLIISKFLQRLSLTCDEVSDGLLALEKIKANDYDLILMDLKMPKLSGLETTQEIIKMNLDKMPKVVALTANAFEEDRNRCLELGMFDFLTKPISFERIKNLIGKVNDSRRL